MNNMMIVLVFDMGVCYKPDDLGNLVKAFWTVAPVHQIKDRVRVKGVYVSMGKEIPQDVVRCQFAEVSQMVGIGDIVDIGMATFGPTPFIVGPAIMAIQCLSIGTWQPCHTSVRPTAIGRALKELCLDRPPKNYSRGPSARLPQVHFDVMYIAAIVRCTSLRHELDSPGDFQHRGRVVLQGGKENLGSVALIAAHEPEKGQEHTKEVAEFFTTVMPRAIDRLELMGADQDEQNGGRVPQDTGTMWRRLHGQAGETVVRQCW